MIRTIAAVAALAAIPALAVAQPNYNYPTDRNGTIIAADELTVQGQLPDRYSIRLNVAGKSDRQVHEEIWDAAYTACQRAPLTSAADMHVDSLHACVSRAEMSASAQYNDILNGRYLRRVDYEY